MKRVVAVLLAAGLLGPGAGARADPGRAGPSGPSVLVQTQVLAAHRLNATLTGYGRVQPDPDTSLSVNLPRAGFVGRLWVRPGQEVAAGTRLLELDTAPAARMAYEQARAAVDYARGAAAHTRRLLAEQLATRDQLAAAQRALRDAQAALAAQRRIGANLRTEIVRAPFAGIITEVDVSQGERVAAGARALIVARSQDLIVPLGLEPEDALQVRPGMPVVLTPVFEHGLSIDSTVTAVHAMVDPRTRLVDVLVRVASDGVHDLMLGMVMRGTIELNSETALAVPRQAVLYDARGAYVFVVQGGIAHRVAVQTGLEQGGLIAVQGALAPGDRIVVLGNYELRDGMRVREGAP